MLDDSMSSSVTASVDFTEVDCSRLLRSSFLDDSQAAGAPSKMDRCSSARQSIVSIPEDAVLATPRPSAPGSPHTRTTLGEAAETLARGVPSSPGTSPSKPPLAPPPPQEIPAAAEPEVASAGGETPRENAGGRATPPPQRSRPSTGSSSLPQMRQGLTTPDMCGLRGVGSLRCGGVPSVALLQPARIADPNHPLRPGTGTLDESIASTAQPGEESFVSRSGFEDLEPADRLVGSVQASLDALNVARASNNRFAVGQLVEALRQAQQAIADAIGEEPPTASQSAVASQAAPRLYAPCGTASSSMLPSARSSVDAGAQSRMSFALSDISGGGSIDMESVLERCGASK